MPVCVVIPIYKERPNEIEQKAISNTINKMAGYDIYFMAPESLYRECYKIYNVRYMTFRDKYFTGEGSYSKLLLRDEFYEAFQMYEYMLIVQTDAWILKKGDDLDGFIREGYDYIGAPWDEGIAAYPWAFKGISYVKKYMKERICYVGNGGLSLRNVKKTRLLLKEKKKYSLLWNTGEDVFFAYHGQDNKCGFRIPPAELAGRFALEKNAEEKISKGQIPFGVHGWHKYYPELMQILSAESQNQERQ